ncbi:Cytochrome c heme lyase subunit CcmF [hydrothermal vent metagenome]|uniref:Cytochrome c heme lyase subunit CcmF n=1 Tax=hydrothermal vent metagenome TaxID=652676 RepID=A0A3B0SDG4_9ZZZZ
MSAEIGHFALILALVLAVIQSTIPLFGVRKGNLRLMRLADLMAIGQMSFVVLSFLALTYAFIVSDFSVELVARNSHSLKPFLYKITGVWANHEGSMLLWVLILSIYGAMVPLFGGALPARLKTLAISVQGMIGVGFLGFILFTSNPFLRLANPPMDGNGLNPLLQDPGLAFHPPFLYLGYVGFSMAFSFSVAALIEGKVDVLWARWLRPWVLAAWSFLTVGIALGSVWAYYELGWGGWWFWDPVENASLLPWLAGTALLHSTLVVERRYALVNWTVLLGILTFSLSLIGTFLVRSGVITSVHAFANDPERGVYILLLLMIASGGALSLYALRANSLRLGNGFDFLSREAGLVINNILLVCATAVVFLGTFYPLFVDIISDDKISVGPPFFDLYVGSIMGALVVFMGIMPMLRWRGDNIKTIAKPLLILFGGTMVMTIAIFLFGKSVLGAVGIGLAFWLFAGTLLNFAQKIKIGQRGLRDNIRMARALPAGVYGFLAAHIGLAVTLVGITSMGIWAEENILMMQPGDSTRLGGYVIQMQDVNDYNGPNYSAETARFLLRKNDQTIGQLRTERRFFPVRKMQTTEAGIHVRPTRNLYVAVGEGDPSRGWAVRIYFHPFVAWIWIGALLMALGGFIALADRRLRLPTTSKINPALLRSMPEPAE